MNKNKKQETDMLDEYDFTGGVRGKYINRLAQGANVVVIEPDLYKQFPNSELVNTALREYLEIQKPANN